MAEFSGATASAAARDDDDAPLDDARRDLIAWLREEVAPKGAADEYEAKYARALRKSYASLDKRADIL